MLIKELKLNIDYLREKINLGNADDAKLKKDFVNFANQLLSGVEYYKSISPDINEEEMFLQQLTALQFEIEKLKRVLETELVPA